MHPERDPWVLSFLLKESKKLVVLIFTGSLLYSLSAATENAQYSKEEVRDLGTTRKPCVAKHKGEISF